MSSLHALRGWPSVAKTNRVEIGGLKCMFSGLGVVKMSYFAIDFEAEMLYPLAPPQGWEEVRSLKI
jgi:hypothetical protein